MQHDKMNLPQYTFHGTTTVGERGQAVIPALAREQLGIDSGEKLLVFTLNNDTVVLTRLESVSRFISEVDTKLSQLRQITDA